MNRIEYWIKAKTQYEVHSPFVFDMYRKVLFARLSPEQKREVKRRHGSSSTYCQLCYKLMDHYHLQQSSVDGCVMLASSNSPLKVMLIDRPHRSRCQEAAWDELVKSHPDYQVAIDLYDAGLLIQYPKLHKQHFLLK